MFCNTCGAQLPDDAQVCPSCGNRIVTPEEARAAQKEAFNQTPADPERYEQLLALKAKQDAEIAMAEARFAQQQAELARQRAAEMQQQYVQKYGAAPGAAAAPVTETAPVPQAAPVQPAPAAPTASPVMPQSRPAGKPKPVKKKKSALPWILIVAVVAAIGAAALVFRSELAALFGGEDNASSRKEKAQAGQTQTQPAVPSGEAQQVPASDLEIPDELQGHTWYVIGSLNNTNWDLDYAMTDWGDGIWKSQVFLLHTGEELKVRADKSWDYNLGVDGRNGTNLRVEEEGFYIVVADLARETIYLEAYNGN